MIHEEICTYEVCKLAKEKGFPQQYDSLTHIYGGKNSLDVGIDLKCKKCEGTLFDISEWNPCLNDIAAPTQSLLQRWLREEKGIVIEVMCLPTTRTSSKYEYKRHLFWGSDGHYIESEYGDEIFDSYELALEDALKFALKNLV